MAAYSKLSRKGPVRVGDMAGELGLEKQTARNWIDNCKLLTRDKNGYVFENLDDEGGED